jgi:hypothetical protein
LRRKEKEKYDNKRCDNWSVWSVPKRCDNWSVWSVPKGSVLSDVSLHEVEKCGKVKIFGKDSNRYKLLYYDNNKSILNSENYSVKKVLSSRIPSKYIKIKSYKKLLFYLFSYMDLKLRLSP